VNIFSRALGMRLVVTCTIICDQVIPNSLLATIWYDVHCEWATMDTDSSAISSRKSGH